MAKFIQGILYGILCMAVMSIPKEANSAEFDLKAIIPRLELIGLEDSRHMGLIHSHDIRKDELTSNELLLVCDLHLEGENVLSCSMAIGAIAVFYKENGRLPHDGMDILRTYSPSLASKENVFEEESEVAALLKGGAGLWRCINPATGRLFEPFDERQWHQFGIFVEEDPMTRLMPVASYNTETGVYESELVGHKMFRVIVFGERPGSVLVDKEIGVIWSGSPEPSSTCSCKK